MYNMMGLGYHRHYLRYAPHPHIHGPGLGVEQDHPFNYTVSRIPVHPGQVGTEWAAINEDMRKRKRVGGTGENSVQDFTVNEIYATSEVKSATTMFNWNIQNFHDICHSQTPLDADGRPVFVPFRSSTFTAGSEVQKQSEWFVRLQPSLISCGNRTGHRQPSILIILCLDKLLGRCAAPISARYTISAANQDGSPINVHGCHFGVQTHMFRPLTDVTRQCMNYYAYAAATSAPFVLIDNLGSTTNTLCVQVKLEILSDPTPTNEGIVDRKLSAESDLLGQISELYLTKNGCDVFIECGGAEVLSAHKTILSARSPVFSRMFEHDMLEKSTQRIKIDDVDAGVMDEVLKYIYSGVLAIPFDFDLFNGILHAADKYELEKLKRFAMEELVRHISLENAGHVSVLAYLHNTDKSTQEKIDAFIDRHCSELWKKSEFRKLLVEHPNAFGGSKD